MRLIITRTDRGVEHASHRQEDETAMHQKEEIEQTPTLQQLRSIMDFSPVQRMKAKATWRVSMHLFL